MRSLLFSFASLFALIASADPSVTSVVARQNWPWGAEVDVDYTLDATEPCDLAYTVSYVADMRPCVEPTVHLYGVKPGANHFTWNPVAKGVSDKNVRDFKVSFAAPVKASDRAFLLIQMATGDVTYASEAQAAALDGFTNELYRTQYMVFRRVPAGDYDLGLTAEELTRLGVTKAVEKTQAARRTVRLSHDYYLGIHVMTAAQYYYANGGSSSQLNYYALSYEALRGKPVEDGIMWPNTGHAVGDNSVVKSFRGKFKLPEGFVLDLPTESQWEAGIRGGTNTILPHFGTPANTDAELLAYLGTIAYTNGGANVGTKAPTAKGFFDPTGIFWELVLEMYNSKDGEKIHMAYPDFRDGSQTVDPVGKDVVVGDATQLWAISCNCGYISKPSKVVLGHTPANRNMRDRTANMAVRWCINTQAIK